MATATDKTVPMKVDKAKGEEPQGKLAQDIMRRFKTLEFLKEPWIPLLQDVADMILPTRTDMRQTDTRGKRQGDDIYDGTAMAAHQLFVDGIQGYMVSNATPWFSLKVGDEVLNEDPEIVAWLQDTTQRLYSTFGRSNFYEAIRPLLEDGTSLGTGYLYPEMDEFTGRVQFTAMHPGECWIADDKYGKVDTLFRKWKTSARQVVQRFGIDKVSDTLRKQFEQDPYRSVTMMHAVYPREDRDTSKRDNTNMRWASVWIEMLEDSSQSSSTRGTVLDEGGYELFPFIVWRYRKTGKEVYGRSPAMDAIGEIMTLNKMSMSVTSRAQLEAMPPLNVHADDKGKVRYRPRGENYYTDPNKKPEVWNLGGGYSIGLDHLTRKQEAIKEHFRTDFFLSISQSTRQMTAYEASLREAEKAAILGPASGRLTSEVFTPIISRVFGMEADAGRILPPPEKLLVWAEESNQPLDVEYNGPMLQAQKRHFATAGISRGLESIAPIAEMRPEIMDKVNWDETTEELLQASGFPQTALNSDEVVAQIRQQRIEVEQAQVQAEQMLNMSQGIKNMADADEATGGEIVGQQEGQ